MYIQNLKTTIQYFINIVWDVSHESCIYTIVNKLVRLAYK